MTPDVMLIGVPTADPLPLAAPAAVFQALLLLTSVLHLVAMNLLVGGAALSLGLRIAGRDAHLRLAQTIARALPTLVAATVTLGVAPLLFVQVLYGRLFYVSSILMGWWWLAVVPVLIAVYYTTYFMAGAARRHLAGAALILVGLFVVGAIYTLNMSLMLGPEQFVARHLGDPSGLELDLADRTVVLRWLHFMVAAVAVASLALGVWGRWRLPDDDDRSPVAMRVGFRGFAIATGVNVLVGLLWLAALPASQLSRFFGGSAAATLLLTLAVASGLVTAGVAYAVSRDRRPARRDVLLSAGGLVLLTIVLMVLVRDQLRQTALDRIQYGWPAAAPQWDVMAVFVICLVAAVGVIAWMVREIATGGQRTRSHAAAPARPPATVPSASAAAHRRRP
jgi:hypothetical protein